MAGAGWRGPQVKLFNREAPLGLHGAEMASTATSEEPATASRAQPVQRGWGGGHKPRQLAGLPSGLLTLTG
ncbi:hypothetical protein C5470_12690 [Photorhabdus stackebrandtii]|uniref:Uncharacterized protein n=1 Tax=Photorhabdus stackebrandtii TaxID=1123042 RepID=A0A7X5TMM8_9GAMM|nr:hypothetical protein [Photorhabdus stackebrandtii]